MKENSPLDKHLDDFNKIVMDLESVDEKISDENQSLILLCSLPKSFDNLVNTLLYGRDHISVQDVKSSLNSSELRKIVQGSAEEGTSAGLTVSRGQQGSRQQDRRSNQRGRSKKREQSKGGRGKSRGKSHGGNGDSKGEKRCWECNKKGHFRSDCSEWKKKQGQSDESETDSEGDTAAVVTREVDEFVLNVTENYSGNNWVLDSGCTFHMTPNREWFVDYKPCKNGRVLMGNNSVCKVAGIGSVQIRTIDGVVRTFTEVRHVPELKRNLISLGALEENGFEWKCKNGVLTVTRGVLVVLKGTRCNGLYLLHGKTVAKGVKGYRLWYSDTKVSKAIVRRHVTFDEQCLLKQKKVIPEQPVFEKETQDKVEFKVHPVAVKARSGRTPRVVSVSPPRAVEEEEGGSPSSGNSSVRQRVQDYSRARDRERRERRSSQERWRSSHADLVAYTLSTIEKVQLEAETEGQQGDGKLLKIPTEENPADKLTKSLPTSKFETCKELVGVFNQE